MEPELLSELKKHNVNKKAVILDKSVAIRKGVESCLFKIGINLNNIYSVSRFHDALNFIVKERPFFIFTEFQIGDKFGLQLIAELEKMGVSVMNRAFFVVTSNSQDSAVAEAAEEDVDAYIVKPFSIDSLESQIVRVLEEKMRPSPYLQELYVGRQWLESNDPNSALRSFQNALGLAKKTTLAYYYIGQSYEALGDFSEALNNYREGLKQHPGHYKCSIGEFETLDRLGRQNEAYEVIINVLLNYPLTPQRLGRVFILAIYTKHFEDVDKYYDIFLKLERRTDELIKIVTAGLYACAKYFCSIGKFEEAVTFFKRCSGTSGRNVDYLKKIIETLLHFKRADLTSDFLNMYSAEEQTSDTWKALDFQILYQSNQIDKTIQKGRKLISEGIGIAAVYAGTAQLLLKQDKKSHAENVIYTGIERCPQNREELLKILTSLNS